MSVFIKVNCFVVWVKTDHYSKWDLIHTLQNRIGRKEPRGGKGNFRSDLVLGKPHH